jgi:hypothetical protein
VVPKLQSKNLAVGLIETPIVVKLLTQVLNQDFLDCVFALPPTEKVDSAAAF